MLPVGIPSLIGNLIKLTTELSIVPRLAEDRKLVKVLIDFFFVLISIERSRIIDSQTAFQLPKIRSDTVGLRKETPRDWRTFSKSFSCHSSRETYFQFLRLGL